MISPDIWTDTKVQSLSCAGAILCYIGTFSNADDYGRIEWDARYLRAKIFAMRDDVTTADVQTWMQEIAHAQLIEPYESEGRAYAFFANWKRVQNPSNPTPSKIPPPKIPEKIGESPEKPGGPREKKSQVRLGKDRIDIVSPLRSETSAKDGKREPSERDLAAYAILAAALPVVIAEHHDLGLTQADWKKRNKAAALSLHDAGKTPEEIAAMLGVAYGDGREFYGRITSLAKLQEHWPRLASLNVWRCPLGNDPCPLSPAECKRLHDDPALKRFPSALEVPETDD